MLSTPQSTEVPEKPEKEDTATHQVLIDKKPSKEKTIFLTFDDGPLNGTQNVLEVLQQEKVPATMFMVGTHITMHKALYQKAMASPYITIANHTYSHANGKYRKFYCNSTGLLKDINHTDTIISGDRKTFEDSGFHPVRLAGRNVFRLPCLSCDDNGVGKVQRNKERTGYDTLAQAGFFIYGWDAEWNFDAKNGKPLKSAKDIVRKLETLYASKRCRQHNKVILLMHDFMFRDCFKGKDNLVSLIRLLKQNGWKFAGIEEYI